MTDSPRLNFSTAQLRPLLPLLGVLLLLGIFDFAGLQFLLQFLVREGLVMLLVGGRLLRCGRFASQRAQQILLGHLACRAGS